MFRGHQNSINQLISRNTTNTTLANQRLDNLSKESLEFAQEETEEKFNKLNEKISTMERNLVSLIKRH